MTDIEPAEIELSATQPVDIAAVMEKLAAHEASSEQEKSS